MEDDRRDYWAAFAIGAVVGIGATLLLQPERSHARHLLREIEPALERARKRGHHAARRGMKKAKRTLRRYR